MQGGRQIGSYRVEERLGAGGFAIVWRAVDEALDDQVAIKVLMEHHSQDETIARRFQDEARILRKLASDRIVRVHTVDMLPNGQPYFVMELADLGTLADRMDARRAEGQAYSVAGALAISAELADCLTVVHDFNVVHRDLKPSNVLYRSVALHQQREQERRGLAPMGEQMLLGDFGIARRLDLRATQTTMVGTPLYMAPEMADPAGLVPVDRRADVYSAAVMLYELLAGEVPFTPVWYGPVLRPRGDRQAPPLRTFRSDVPVGLEDAINRALSADPEARFSTAWEWGEVLRHWRFELSRASDIRRAPTRRRPAPRRSILVSGLSRLCDDALRSTPPDDHALAERLAQARARLRGPLRVGVVEPAPGPAPGLAAGLAADGLVATAVVGTGALSNADQDVMASAHAFVVVLGPDVDEGRAHLRAVRRIVRDRLSPATALGVVVDPATAGQYEADGTLRAQIGAPVGLEALNQAVAERFVRYREMLAAMGGFRDLGRALATTSSEGADRLAAELERLRIDAHEIAELEVSAGARAGLLNLPETLADDLGRVLSQASLTDRLGVPESAGVKVIRDAAERGAARWRSFVNGGRADEAAARAGEVVALSYERLWARADALASA